MRLLAALQLPSFEAQQVRAAVELHAIKVSARVVTSFDVVLLAYNATNPGGIGGKWLKGLQTPTIAVRCGTPIPCTENCGVIWLTSQSHPCSVFNESHIDLKDILSLQNGYARLRLVGNVMSLAESQYNFSLHLPVQNPVTAYEVVSIIGTFDIQAVASSNESRVLLCGDVVERTCPSELPQSASRVPLLHRSQLTIDILAADVDGHPIERSGEVIKVRLVFADSRLVAALQTQSSADVTRSYAGSQMAEFVEAIAEFSSESKRYTHTVLAPQASGWRPGRWVVALACTGQSAEFTEAASFSVTCGDGFTPTDGYCQQPQSYIIIGSVLAAVIVFIFLLLLYLIKRHQDDLKAFLLSFLSFELTLGAEICADAWGKPATHGTLACFIWSVMLHVWKPDALRRLRRRRILLHRAQITRGIRLDQSPHHPVWQSLR